MTLLVIAPPQCAKDIERFHSKYVVSETGCWIWTSYIFPRGYASFCTKVVGGKSQNVYAHRVSYTWFVGPIEDGLEIDHLCRTPACVNPAHLEPVTSAENRRRAVAARQFCKHGHEFTPENTYVRKSGARNCRECGRATKRKRWHEGKDHISWRERQERRQRKELALKAGPS